MRSSSFHRITSDRGNLLYKVFARIVHTPLNFINNLNAKNNIDPKLKISFFTTDYLNEQYQKLDELASPSRKLSDLFWMNLDWNSMNNDLNGINICDIGCGSGNYFLKLKEYSNNKVIKYKGLDIYENNNWETLKSSYQEVNFQKYDGRNIIDLIPKNTNLIISQSAIEHFSEDITVFKQILNFVKSTQHSVYQIHLFPSKVCLRLYPFHGVRQYTPRNISKITRLFSSFAETELFELGGESANKIHLEYINKGRLNKDIRNQTKETYEKLCFQAIKKDINKHHTKVPNFYALVIKSYK